jgi:hypothetical protein
MFSAYTVAQLTAGVCVGEGVTAREALGVGLGWEHMRVEAFNGFDTMVYVAGHALVHLPYPRRVAPAATVPFVGSMAASKKTLAEALEGLHVRQLPPPNPLHVSHETSKSMHTLASPTAVCRRCKHLSEHMPE